jgi:SAM-dependent methyltransferase
LRCGRANERRGRIGRRLLEFQPTPPRDVTRGKKHHAMSRDYAKLYEDHAVTVDPKASIGDGDFDAVGQVELRILELEGLRPDSSLLDFGCGVGRLAMHAIPFLAQGRYLGLDISPSMIESAREVIAARFPGLPADRYRFGVNDGEHVARWGTGFDMICAYSLFTHMELEDTYRYLAELTGMLCEGGKLVCSVLPLETQFARDIFLREAAMPLAERWNRVRNVCTSYEAMEQVATLAGLRNFRWYRGDQITIHLRNGTCTSLAQSAIVGTKQR